MFKFPTDGWYFAIFIVWTLIGLGLGIGLTLVYLTAKWIGVL
jgi:hypothetical protein